MAEHENIAYLLGKLKMVIRAPATAILGLNLLSISLPSLAQQSIEICDEISDGILPYDNHIRGKIPIGDGEIRSNLVIAGGHETDYFKHCVFSESDEFGWTWGKGDIELESFK